MMKGSFFGWVALGLAGAACTDNGRDVGYLADASQQSGGRSSGGSSGKGGASTGGSSRGGAAGTGGAAGSAANPAGGGKPGAGGGSTGNGGAGRDLVDASHPPSSGGGAPSQRDAATDSTGLPLCGAFPCLSTTCAGFGCGAARCCETDSGPVCVRGAQRCPGEPAAVTLQCWPGTSGKPTDTFDKTCKVDADCVVVEHWNGCCAASVVGVAASQKATFDAFEQQTCGGQPPCGCCCDQIHAEDGMPVVPPATGKAICFAGACMAVGQ